MRADSTPPLRAAPAAVKIVMNAVFWGLGASNGRTSLDETISITAERLSTKAYLSYEYIISPPLLPPLLFLLGTQQQKNTCAHNNTHKAHANGIKKKKRTKYVSTRGMDPKFLRNQKFSKKYNKSKRVVE